MKKALFVRLTKSVFFVEHPVYFITSQVFFAAAMIRGVLGSSDFAIASFIFQFVFQSFLFPMRLTETEMTAITVNAQIMQSGKNHCF